MTRYMDLEEYKAYLCRSCGDYQEQIASAKKRAEVAQERLRALLLEVHEHDYEIDEELEIKIRQALDLPLGDEDEQSEKDDE